MSLLTESPTFAKMQEDNWRKRKHPDEEQLPPILRGPSTHSLSLNYNTNTGTNTPRPRSKLETLAKNDASTGAASAKMDHSMATGPLAVRDINVPVTSNGYLHKGNRISTQGIASQLQKSGEDVIDLVSSDEDESYKVRRPPLLSKPRDDALDSFFATQKTSTPASNLVSEPQFGIMPPPHIQTQRRSTRISPSETVTPSVHTTEATSPAFVTKRSRGRPRKDAPPFQPPVRVPKPRGRPPRSLAENQTTRDNALRTDEPPTYRTQPVVMLPPRRVPFVFDLQDPHRTRIQHQSQPPLYLYNNVNNDQLPPTFQFINQYIFRKGTEKTPEGFVVGCTCGPHNGRDIGCEYLQKCGCMEDATRPVEIDGKVYHERVGFPYSAADASFGCLRDVYLERNRFVVYECNDKCNCGPNCKNKVVSRGRQVPLEIFRTLNRGWGVRCLQDLQKGQFVDVYLGEVITDEEADRREAATQDTKDSYLFGLDKFAGTQGLTLADCWIVDGQFYGNATRFINHSCEPNLVQISVSLNRGDPHVYELAFFAKRDIAVGEELSFDYLDKDAEDENNDQDDIDENARENKGKRARCLCGTPSCRQWLWF